VSFSKAELWLNVHSAITILCACLPVYTPIRDLCGRFVHSICDRYGSSVCFLRSSSGGARRGSSKNSTDSENTGHGLGSREYKAGYPTYMAYHYPTKEVSSTIEPVLLPPTYGGNLSGPRWSETWRDEYAISVPPRAIVRTRVEVV
jgi:hypothetical protein